MKKDKKGSKDLLLTFHTFAHFSILWVPFFSLISLKKRSGKGSKKPFCSLLLSFDHF